MQAMTTDEFAAKQASLGLTNRQLAEKLNCDEGSLSRWKRGITAIPDYIAGYLDLLVYVHQNAIELTFTLGELSALSARANQLGMTVNQYLVYLVRKDIKSVSYTTDAKQAEAAAPAKKVAEGIIYKGPTSLAKPKKGEA